MGRKQVQPLAFRFPAMHVVIGRGGDLEAPNPAIAR
ncbi:hypothetical protein MGAST_15115 [Mycobacterium gastri 'Wayne']|nr:hypothetical protein MGAST_15115 [Mycobacterium gastri 'Wayne']